MSTGRQVELPLISKSPFANYDIVVYLGGGLFALMICWRYIIEPFSIFDFSQFTDDPEAVGWFVQATFILLLGFIAYVVGHLVAYLSSYFIEGFLTKTLGKFSETVKISTCHPNNLNKRLRAQIRRNVRSNFGWHKINIPLTSISAPIGMQNFLVWIFHAPMQLWYRFVYWRGYFRFADTRLPTRMFDHLDIKMTFYFGNVNTKYRRQWFRWVEYYTNYNAPVARASMYNYLTISGLMRSLSFSFLCALWFEIIHLAVFVFRSCAFPTDEALITHGDHGLIGFLAYTFVIVVAYICTVTSYFKFFRRYVEEAVMGFLLEVPKDPYSPHRREASKV